MRLLQQRRDANARLTICPFFFTPTPLVAHISGSDLKELESVPSAE
jgi:hypothetical protein